MMMIIIIIGAELVSDNLAIDSNSPKCISALRHDILDLTNSRRQQKHIAMLHHHLR